MRLLFYFLIATGFVAPLFFKEETRFLEAGVLGVAAGALFLSGPGFKKAAWGNVFLALGILVAEEKTRLFFSLGGVLQAAGYLFWMLQENALGHQAAPRFKTRLVMSAVPAGTLAVVGYFLFFERNGLGPEGLPLLLMSIFLLEHAKPAVEGALLGMAPEGRLSWIIGFLLLWLAALLSWKAPSLEVSASHLQAAFLVAHTLVNLGWLGEQKEAMGRFWPAVIALGALEMIWLSGFWALKGEDENIIFLWMGMGACVLFWSFFLLLFSTGERLLAREREYLNYVTLLDGLTHFGAEPTVLDEKLLLEVFCDELASAFPQVAGVAYGEEGVMGGMKTAYVVDLHTAPEGTKVGSLYLKEKPTKPLLALLPLVTTRLLQAMTQLELHTQVLTDPLSSLYNRRAFSRLVENIVHKSRSYHEPMAVGMVDIDHFKAVNDTLGHAAGDLAIREVAQVLSSQVRPHDYVFRWGGEEFLLVFGRLNKSLLPQVLERFRRSIFDADITGASGRLTVSIGGAGGEVIHSLDDLYTAIEAADKALYAAKHEGRNRVMIVEPAKEGKEDA